MSRKDYRVIAGALNKAYHRASHISDQAEEGVKQTIEIVCNDLATLYPNFDRKKFINACYS